jgi:hypothetical protein
MPYWYVKHHFYDESSKISFKAFFSLLIINCIIDDFFIDYFLLSKTGYFIKNLNIQQNKTIYLR